MAKVFDMQSELHENPNRNNFDGTHKRHMTGKFGYIYPFLCEPVVPTDSWELDTAIGVNLMPMWYPTQSNMRFIVHYFYVPNRIIMDDWKNMLEGLDTNAELPWLDKGSTFYRTGSLADYLGIPTTYTLPEDTHWVYTVAERSGTPARGYYGIAGTLPTDSVTGDIAPSIGSELSSIWTTMQTTTTNKIPTGTNSLLLLPDSPLLEVSPVNASVDHSSVYGILFKTGVSLVSSGILKFGLAFFGSDSPIDLSNRTQVNSLKLIGYEHVGTINSTSRAEFCLPVVGDDIHWDDVINGYIGQYPYVYCALQLSGTAQTNFCSSNDGYLQNFTFSTPAGLSIEIADYPNYCPYYKSGHTQNTVKVRSLPFRVYEMVYNSFYRDSHGVQPFVVGGQTKYNDYISTHGSGRDTTNYELKTRNWELDAYTSCLPSPQQGNAPLIGVTVDGRMTIRHDDGGVSSIELRDLDGQAGVEVRNSEIDPEHPEDARQLLTLSSSGMTIADFRYGNALTRFLETSLRTGFRYADFIFGHFGSAPKHQELDMPIFLGGYTQVVDTSKVTNVTASANPSDPKLGQFAGVGQSFDAMRHSIKHYFDDFGYVLGVVMLVPDAAYSQILPKHFTYNNRLDYFFPEFSQLGLQPITYEEVCPIQSYAEYVNGASSKLLTDTFGYQRPNHDLVWFPDTVHGEFRKSLKGSVIQKRFGLRPELSDEFLRIKPEECNDIFSVVEASDDTWIGQIVCKITMQRPVSRVIIPSLGR